MTKKETTDREQSRFSLSRSRRWLAGSGTLHPLRQRALHIGIPTKKGNERKKTAGAGDFPGTPPKMFAVQRETPLPMSTRHASFMHGARDESGPVTTRRPARLAADYPGGVGIEDSDGEDSGDDHLEVDVARTSEVDVARTSEVVATKVARVGYSPFMLMHGREPLLPGQLRATALTPQPQHADEYVQRLQHRH